MEEYEFDVIQIDNITRLSLLPQILREYNIPLKLEITQKDIDDIFNIKDYSFITSISSKISTIESMTFSFDTFNRESQLKYWLILIFAHCFDEQGKDSSSFPHCFCSYAKLIQKLFKEGLFSLEEISILLKATLVLSCVRPNSDIQRSKSICSIKYIKLSLMVLKDLFNDEINENEQEMLYDYFVFFEQIILNNDYNINIIYSHIQLWFLNKFFSKQSYHLPLQFKLNNKLLQIVSKIYIGKFDNKVMKAFLADLQSFLINFNTQSNDNLYHNCIQANVQICFIKDLIEKERIEYSKAIRQGFFFTSSRNSGMMFDSNVKLKEFTLLFSFKSNHSNIENVNQTLISFRLKNYVNVFSLFIENGRLVVLINKEERKPTQFQINQGDSYICMLTCSKSKRSGTISLSCYCNGVLEDFKSETRVSVKDEVLCFIGYSPEEQATYDHFEGEMGTIIFFHDKLSDKTIQFLKDLGFDYDKILYLSRYERSSINKYEIFNPVNYNIIGRSWESYNQRKKEFLTQIHFVISQKSFYLSSDKEYKTKVKYRLNFLDFKPKEESFNSPKVKLLAPFSNEFFIFEKKFTIVELLKLNGLQFLGLHLEYYCQLLKILPHIQETNKMQMVSTM